MEYPFASLARNTTTWGEYTAYVTVVTLDELPPPNSGMGYPQVLKYIRRCCQEWTFAYLSSQDLPNVGNNSISCASFPLEHLNPLCIHHLITGHAGNEVMIPGVNAFAILRTATFNPIDCSSIACSKQSPSTTRYSVLNFAWGVADSSSVSKECAMFVRMLSFILSAAQVRGWDKSETCLEEKLSFHSQGSTIHFGKPPCW